MAGRYTILGSIAKGGMATVYLGRVTGSAGFSRLVAVKRLHPQLAVERDFVAMLVDEARLASQIRHTNVIDTLDLVMADGAFSVVLEYVEGDSLSSLSKRVSELGEKVPQPIALAIMYGVLRGLDAAHDARSEDGEPLGMVHRDVSPQNVLVGVDGIPRVIDFGVAKAIGRFDSTKPGEIRGKFSYMAPEQLQARPVTRQVDVYAAGVVLWELLTSTRLFEGEDERVLCATVMVGDIEPPSSVNPDVPAALDAVVLRATARELGQRYLTARELLAELEPFPRASDDEVGAWVRRLCAKRLAARQKMIQLAPPASDGRPIDELMIELARDGASAVDADTLVDKEPPVSANLISESYLASTAGRGVEIPLPYAQTSSSVTPSRPRSFFVPALMVVAGLVLVGLFVRLRPGDSNGSNGASPTFPAPLPLPLVPPPASAEPEPVPATTASAASSDKPTTTDPAPAPTPSHSSLHPVRRPILRTPPSAPAASQKVPLKDPKDRP